MEKGLALRYFVIVIVLASLSVGFVFLRGTPNSFVFLEDSGEEVFLFNELNSSEFIDLKEVNFFEKTLEVDYLFDPSNLVGDSVSLDIWVNDFDGNEITRVKDRFPLNKDGLIERKLSFASLESDLPPAYLYFSFVGEEPISKYSLVSSKAPLTGLVVADDEENMLGFVGSFVLLLFILIGVLIFIRKYGKRKEEPFEG